MAEDRGGSNETEKERLDRNLEQLLQELRVALPGVQVLFAFLLTVPFAQGFDSLTEFQRHVYFLVLLATALATALLIAPTAIHRALFRQGMKREIVMQSNKVSIAGLCVLAVAMSGAVFLIAHLIFSPATAIVSGSAALLVFAALWYALPVSIEHHQGDAGGEGL
jgi:hypothetical protein